MASGHPNPDVSCQHPGLTPSVTYQVGHDHQVAGSQASRSGSHALTMELQMCSRYLTRLASMVGTFLTAQVWIPHLRRHGQPHFDLFQRYLWAPVVSTSCCWRAVPQHQKSGATVTHVLITLSHHLHSVFYTYRPTPQSQHTSWVD